VQPGSVSDLPGASHQPFGDLEETWTEVDGHLIRSFSTGQRTALPEVVLIPGMGAPLALYPWARRIGRWSRATVLDLPGWQHGHGRGSPSTVAAVGAAAARWLEVTDAHDVVLVGHSSGSQSALHVARLVPERLVGLVLSAPTLDPRVRRLPVLLVRLLEAVVQERPTELPTALPWARGVVPWFRLAHSVARDRPEHLVPVVRPPILLLSGENDRFAPPVWAKHLASLVPSSHVVIPGPHNACFTSPDAADTALHQVVLRWISAADPCSGPV